MRGVNRYLWVFVLAMVMIMVSSSVRAEIIAFSSDRLAVPEQDVWLSRSDGSQQVLFSSTPDEPFTDHRSRPSICNDGRRIFYDHLSGSPEYVGELWVKKTSGVGQPKKVLDCTNPTGSPNCFNLGGPPPFLPWCGPAPVNPLPEPLTGGPCGCKAVDCGQPATAFDGNPRILFTYGNPIGFRDNILMATWDVSSETLSAPCLLTATGGTAENPGNNLDPAWCGSNHVVFSRTHHLSTAEPTICTMAIPAPGATEPPEIRCHDTPDFLDERYPSCGRRNGGENWTVAFALQKTGATNSIHRICTVELDQTTFDFIPDSEHCTPNEEEDLTISWTKPTWNPGGTEIAFAANMDELGDPAGDYDIYRIGSDTDSLDNGGPIVANTTNTDEDNDPDWGP